MGNRIAKHIYTDNAFTLLEKSTYYVRDASGNVMAVYDRIIDASVETGEFMLSERHIYGSSRIGMDVSTHVFGLDPFTSLTETTRELGHKQFEISNHLGNVLSVITDQKLPVEVGSLIVSYSAVVVTATDYSPFGVGLYGRSWSGEYRYGFQAQESSQELSDIEGNLEFKFRSYNPKIGRCLSTDPITGRYPSIGAYAFSENKVIAHIEIEGLECTFYTTGQNDDSRLVLIERNYPKYNHGFRVDKNTLHYLTPEAANSAQMWAYAFENNGGSGHSVIINLTSSQVWEAFHPMNETGRYTHGATSWAIGGDKSIGYTFSIYDPSFWDLKESGWNTNRGDLYLCLILMIDPNKAESFLNSYVDNPFNYNLLSNNCKDFCEKAITEGGREDLSETSSETPYPAQFPVAKTLKVSPYRDDGGNLLTDENNCVILKIENVDSNVIQPPSNN